jgi:hypothetical protein
LDLNFENQVSDSMSDAVETVESSEPQLKMTMPDALLSLWRFTDSSAVRFALGFVRVNFKENYAEATDGRILVRHRIDFNEAFSLLDPVLFWGSDLRRISRYSAKLERFFDLKLWKTGDNWFAGNPEVEFKIQTDDGRFPDTDVVFNSTPVKTANFSLNMQLLRRMCLAFGNSEYEQELQFTVPLDGSPLIELKCKKGVVFSRLAAMAESRDAIAVSIVEDAIKDDQ